MSNTTAKTMSCRNGKFQKEFSSVLLALIVAAAMLLAGCNPRPKYNIPSVPIAPTFKEIPDKFKEVDGWKIAEPNDGVIRGKWWEMYGDTELSSLEEQVNVSNQNIALAVATFRAARALVLEARSQYFPTVSASPSATVARPSASGGRSANGNTTTTTGGGTGGGTGGSTGTGSNATTGGGNKIITDFSLPVDASWVPDLFSRVRNQVAANAYSAQASAADVENVRLTMQSELASDYFQLQGQDAQIELLESVVAAYQKALELTTVLFETGIDSEEDVSQARTQLETAKAQLIDLGVQRALLEHAIAVLTGQTPSSFSLQRKSLNAKPPAIPVGLPTQLLERRPDIAATERRMASANAQIGVTKAAFYPSLNLSLSGGLQASSIGSLFSLPSAFWSLGSTLTQVLFDGGLRRAQTEESNAIYDETVATYRQTVLSAFQAVEDNLSSLRIQSQELLQQQIAIKSAQRTLELANDRYKLGIDSYLNVITAQTTLYTNQRTEVTIRTNEMVSSVQLVMALGGGWDASQLPAPKVLGTKTQINP